MIALHNFNHLPYEEALARISACVALPAWADALVRGRPYSSQQALFSAAQALAQKWDEAALAQALSAHPRIGETPSGTTPEAALSRQEQGAVEQHHADALRDGNARYEARFRRVFLIRAKGRTSGEIVEALRARLENSEAQELEIALEQLREITLLRLEGAIGE